MNSMRSLPGNPSNPLPVLLAEQRAVPSTLKWTRHGQRKGAAHDCLLLTFESIKLSLSGRMERIVASRP